MGYFNTLIFSYSVCSGVAIGIAIGYFLTIHLLRELNDIIRKFENVLEDIDA